MHKILKRVAVLGVGAMLLMANFLPIFKVSAIENAEQYARILMRGATDFANDGLTYNFLYDNGSVAVTGFAEHPTVENTEWDYGDHIGTMLVLYTKASALHFATTPVDGFSGELWIGGAQTELTDGGYDLSNLEINHEYELEFRFHNDGEGPHEGNTEATVRIRGGEGSYTEYVRDADNNIIDEREVPYSESYVETSFAINGGWMSQMMPEDAKDGGYSETTYRYDSEEADETVDIAVATLWHMRFVDEVVINDTAYAVADYINYNNQQSYLDHYAGQVVGFVIEGVAKADVYDITVKVEKSEHTFIGNFLWTADPAQEWERNCHDEGGEEVCEYILDENGDKVPGRNYIGHSSLALVNILYTVGTTTYSCTTDSSVCSWWEDDDEENATSCSLTEEDCSVPYVEFNSGSAESGYDDGSLVIPAGALITMRVVPDYGYQVMNVNMSELTTNDNGVGEFTFEVPDGAAYFVADVVKMEDVLNTETELVKDGTINLGAGQTTLNHGTAKLNIADVELTEENIAAFENAADEYNIKNYLDISLYNITCKGAEACTGTDDDSWVERVRDLNEPATITLQLEDGVDGNDIVIVHEKHDGTYEIIPTAYDPETQTIIFTTTSFSNYAIASRTVDSPETGQATNTENGSASDGATVVATAVMVGFAFIGGIVFVIMNAKKRKAEKANK